MDDFETAELETGETLHHLLRSGFPSRFPFPSSSILSRTRNAVILRIRGSGSGFSSGNWIDPFAVINFESSFAKALTADGVG
jgi:hypothetical protein